MDRLLKVTIQEGGEIPEAAEAPLRVLTAGNDDEFVDDTTAERVVGDSLQMWYFPPHAPESNPAEGCWDQQNPETTSVSLQNSIS